MTLLSPWIFAAALAAMAVPIVLLHMLKLRRQPRPVSTTLLWKRTVEDLVANAPFQRLRWSLLLLLQVAVAGALAWALGRPTSAGAAQLGRQVVVLLDRSASMAAPVGEMSVGERPVGEAPLGATPGGQTPVGRELAGGAPAQGPPRTRFDLAREEVRRLLASVDEGVEIMLVAFAERPVALGGFELSRPALESALDGIQLTDEEADLEAALTWASSMARGSAGDAESGDLPTVVLITDGNVRPPARGAFEVAAGAVDVRIVPAPAAAGWAIADVTAATGRSTPSPSDRSASAMSPSASPRAAAIGVDNVGITALAAERRYDDPALVNLFVRLTNAAPAAVPTVLTVEVDDRTLLRRAVDVPAARDGAMGEATLLERIELRDAGILVVRQGRPDSLRSDDAAAVRMPAPRRPSIVVVAPGSAAATDATDAGPAAAPVAPAAPVEVRRETNVAPDPDPFLLAVLEAAAGAPRSEDDLGGVRVVSEETWREMASSTSGGAEVLDLVVFDRVRPAELPAVSSLTIGAAPQWLPVKATEDAGRARRVLSWQRGHPLLRHVDLDELLYGTAMAFDLESAEAVLDAEALVIGPEGAVLAAIEDRGARHAALAFPLRRSNLPALPAFPVLVQNAIDWLGAAGAGQAARSWRPGEPISVRVRSDVSRLEVRGPSGEVIEVPVDETQGRALLPPLERSGVWTVRGAVPDEEIVPISMLSELESGLRPLWASGSVQVRDPALPIAVMAPRDRRPPEPRHADLWPLAVGAALLLLLVEGLVWAVRAGRT